MRQKEQWEGSVTVFFSLIFTLLLSFSLTFYQMAVEAARGSFEFSAAKLAVESFFAAYHYPMYEIYHIFGREMQEAEDEETGEAFMERLVLADLQEMTAAGKGKLSLLRRNGAVVEVQDVVYLTEQEGDVFFNEAISYMKYESVSNLFRLFEEQEQEAERVEARLQFMEQKTAVDKAYAELEEDFILLMELIDGVELEKYEKYLGGKKITFTKPYYVKFFSIYQESDARGYFTRNDIFSAYLKHHVNLFYITGEMQTLIEEWKSLLYEQLVVENRIFQISESIELLLMEIEQAKEEQAGQKEQEKKEEKKKLLISLEKEKNDLFQQQEDIEERMKQLRKVLQKKQSSFLKQCSEVLAICQETNRVLEQMDVKLTIAKEKREQLKDVLNGIEVLDQNEIAMWKEELQEYDCYETENAYDFEQMKKTIKNNCKILTFILQNTFKEESACEVVEQCIVGWNQKIAGYTFDGLVLEYGNLEPATVSLKETEQIVSKNLSEQLLDLLLVEEVSEAVLNGKNLPSKEYFEAKQENTDISSLFEFEQIETLLKLLQSQNGTGIVEILSSSILFQAYLKEHFNSYLSENGWKDSVLQYEQEYLLVGNESDLKNLTQSVLQIIMMRMALHFSSILTNIEKRETAEQAAVALAGVTGMPALKYVATTVFLLIWSLEEAFVDVAALLAGKKLSIYPGPEGGCILFSELLFFTKSMIAEKIEKKNELGTILTDYTDYLQILLLLKGKTSLCYRAMDLIQTNLQENGVSNFYIKKCICGAKIKKNNMEWEYYY